MQERLRYVEHAKKRKPSTLRDYRNVARHDLLPHFGKETPMRKIVRGRVVDDAFTSDDIDSILFSRSPVALLSYVEHRFSGSVQPAVFASAR